MGENRPARKGKGMIAAIYARKSTDEGKRRRERIAAYLR